MHDHPSALDRSRHAATRASRLSPVLFLLFLRCQAAAIGPMMALMMIPIAGAIAFGIEMGGWYYFQRSMQNAADSAAIAAATNNSATGSTFLNEARAAARPYGYVDGVNNTTVTAATVTCPAGVTAGATCYESTVATIYPLSFSNVIGFGGSDDLGDGRGQKVTATAIAVASGSGSGTAELCVLALSTASNAFDSNGGPKPDMSGCSLMSNGGMTCSGHNLGADYGIAAGTSSVCGKQQVSGAPQVADPYSALAANIQKFTCGDSPSDVTVSADITASTNYCGNVKLTKDVNITSPNTVITIRNGALDMNGHSLRTSSGASATIVFSGSNSSTRLHYPTDTSKGTSTAVLDVRAPSTSVSPWKGVAIYQDPALTTNVSFTYAGNKPTWNITGLAYFPKADIQFSGAVNKSASGATCFVIVTYTIRVNGTAYILSDSAGCASAGLDTPDATIPGAAYRTRLVR